MGPVKAIDSTRMRGNFSNHAGDYDSYASVQKRVVELLCNAVHLFALNPGPLLDVGTGTGALASRLSASVAERPFVIVDIAHGMTQEASKRMPAALACDGDAKLLPFAGDSFPTARRLTKASRGKLHMCRVSPLWMRSHWASVRPASWRGNCSV